MTAKVKIGDVVEVKWMDAWCDQSTTAESDWMDSCTVLTYGVLRRSGGVVTVVSEVFEDGRGRGTTHIPRVMVRSVRRLK